MWKPNTKYIVDSDYTGDDEDDCYAFLTDSISLAGRIIKTGGFQETMGEWVRLSKFNFAAFKEIKEVKKKAHLPGWW